MIRVSRVNHPNNQRKSLWKQRGFVCKEKIYQFWKKESHLSQNHTLIPPTPIETTPTIITQAGPIDQTATPKTISVIIGIKDMKDTDRIHRTATITTATAGTNTKNITTQERMSTILTQIVDKRKDTIHTIPNLFYTKLNQMIALPKATIMSIWTFTYNSSSKCNSTNNKCSTNSKHG